MDIFLLASVVCLVIVTVGYAINKSLRMPWMFTVVVFGMVLSGLGLFREVTTSANFQLLARMGMLFFLFTIGVELDLKEIRKLGAHIVGGEILLTLTEGLLIAALLYFGFPQFVSHSPVVAVLCGIAFGTVGEVMLLALLKEFGLEKTRFGQLGLGIGVADDIWELLVLAVIIALPAFTSGIGADAAWNQALTIVLSLVGLVVVTVVLSLLGKTTRRYLDKIPLDSFVLPFIVLGLLYAFLYFGTRASENLGVVAAVFSGIAISQMLPEKVIQQYKKPIFFVGNIFLGPFFFLSLGGNMSFGSLLGYPVLIVAIMAITLLSRLSVSYILFNKLLGKRQSMVMGIGLCNKFSTSIISESLLFTSGLIAQPLYTAMMATFILLKPIIIGVFSRALAVTKDTIQ